MTIELKNEGMLSQVCGVEIGVDHECRAVYCRQHTCSDEYGTVGFFIEFLVNETLYIRDCYLRSAVDTLQLVSDLLDKFLYLTVLVCQDTSSCWS